MRSKTDGSDRVAVGLDLGTTKIAAVIAELEGRGRVKVLGVGSSPSEGLRRGVVVDVEKTVQAIQRAVQEAELMAGVDVHAVYAGIAGEHIDSCNSRGVVAVSGMGGEISMGDRGRVIDAARAVSVAGGRQILHVLPQEYFVDGEGGIRDPVGIAGVRLEAEVHLVTGAATAVQNIRNSIIRAGLAVREVILEPLAATYAVLDDDEREMGVCLIDIGGGTTNVALSSLGSVHHTAVIGLGGQNVTNDLAVGLRTSWSQAEKIKCTSGTVLPETVDDDDLIEVPGVAGRDALSVPRRRIASIIGMRMEEVFGLVRDELRAANLARPPDAGVVLTGGGALITGVADLAERVFDMPVRVGLPTGITGMTDKISSPVYATGLGLVLFGLSGPDPLVDGTGHQRGTRERRDGWWRSLVEWIRSLF